jgi:DNA polymerase
MTRHIHVDIETRSTVDLRKSGAYPYFEHPDTDVWCIAFAVDDGPLDVWTPGEPVPDVWRQGVAEGWAFFAHNAQFERTAFRLLIGPRHGWPVPALEQWHCTAAMAAAMSLPRDLAGAAKALGLAVQKDDEGKRLMLRMAKPRKVAENGALTWWDEPDRVARLIDYCKTDVEVERALTKRLRPLDASERRVYLLDQTINDRGVGLDLPLIAAAQAVVDVAGKRLNRELREVTAGHVTAATKAADLTRWLVSRGVETDSVAKPAVRDILARDDLPADVRRAVEIRAEAAKSSTAKLRAMEACASSGDRARGLLLYHGAGTGRWAGRLAQPQNYPRGSVQRVEDAIPLIRHGEIELMEMLHGSPMEVVSSLLRGCFVPAPGHRLIAADYSNIEGRVTAWLSGERWKVDAFRAFDAGTGPDLYKLAYSKSFGVAVKEVTKDQRQLGKVQELALGYQGGKGAFNAMAALYGIDLPEAEVQAIVQAWRAAHPHVVALWRDLEDAAFSAVARKGAVAPAANGRVRFVVKGGFLWMILPSGRPLAYPSPSIRAKVMPWTDRDGEPVVRDVVSFWGVDSRTRQWARQYGYGGLWTENAVQAIARDVLAHAMLALEAKGYPIVLTVHDEIIAEVPAGRGDLPEFETIMCALPTWANGFPVAAEGWEGDRYRK